MTYEKKYKESVEKLRYKISDNNGNIDYKAVVNAEELQDIFPELAESEDERIRKEIFHFVLENTLSTDMRQHRWLAWLEKQGEQNPNSCDGCINRKGCINCENRDMKETEHKVEPKFKVGDFIVNDYCMGKVIELTNDAYLLDTGQGIPFSCEHNAHLWTIQDAKGNVSDCQSCYFNSDNTCVRHEQADGCECYYSIEDARMEHQKKMP